MAPTTRNQKRGDDRGDDRDDDRHDDGSTDSSTDGSTDSSIDSGNGRGNGRGNRRGNGRGNGRGKPPGEARPRGRPPKDKGVQSHADAGSSQGLIPGNQGAQTVAQIDGGGPIQGNEQRIPSGTSESHSSQAAPGTSAMPDTVVAAPPQPVADNAALLQPYLEDAPLPQPFPENAALPQRFPENAAPPQRYPEHWGLTFVGIVVLFFLMLMLGESLSGFYLFTNYHGVGTFTNEVQAEIARSVVVGFVALYFTAQVSYLVLFFLASWVLLRIAAIVWG
ncbi:MAG: hypothetical protein Q9201_002972 [Fulgogasparrea decipioides]